MIIKKFNDFVNEQSSSDDNGSTSPFKIGDLIFNKHVGNKGLVGLIISDSHKDDDGVLVHDVLYRGYGGDVIETPLTDMVDIIDGGYMSTSVNNGDISAYKSISSKKGITLNSKYKEYLDNEDNDDESLTESKKAKVSKIIDKNNVYYAYHYWSKLDNHGKPVYVKGKIIGEETIEGKLYYQFKPLASEIKNFSGVDREDLQGFNTNRLASEFFNEEDIKDKL